MATGCKVDDVDEIDFSVSVRNDMNEIYVGDEVVFDFAGRADYVTFFSGENGSNYDNRDRVEADINNLDMSYTIVQEKTTAPFYDRKTVGIYISDDFNGKYDKENIESATWVELSASDPESWKVPAPANDKKVTVKSGGNLMSYSDRPFYLAFRYSVSQDIADRVPAITIKPISIAKTTHEGQKFTFGNPLKDFGFRNIVLAGKDISNVDEAQIAFKTSENYKECDNMMISQQINPRKVTSDTGSPIRTLNMPIESYTYKYQTPGEYKVVFLARNANMWNTQESVYEINLTVKAKQ